MPREEAIGFFFKLGEKYKVELLEEFTDPEVSFYQQGDFIDLCRGPHIPHSGYLKAFKLTSVAGAYWRGDERNPMLQRIYGTAFFDAESLKRYLTFLEEAQKRDHRRLGKELDLFSFSDEVGAGMVIYHPKGALIRHILENFEKREHLRRGYQIVVGPTLLKTELWKKSGHFENYRENMYFTEIEEQSYGVKPMNCLSHMLIYKSRIRSYRDLPLRYFELGTVHRHEKSGVLHGLLRVRQFTQDDAHILCMPEQLNDEIKGIIDFIIEVMGISVSISRWKSAPGLRSPSAQMKIGNELPVLSGRRSMKRVSSTRYVRGKELSTGLRSTSNSRTLSTVAGSAPLSSVISRCRIDST